VPIIDQITVQRMECVGIVIDDLADAVAFCRRTRGARLIGEARAQRG
jgi:hypothetical protein